MVPVAIHGTQTWRPGGFQPVSIAWGETMTFDGLPEGRQGLQGGVRARAGRDPAALGLARGGSPARPARRDPRRVSPETRPRRSRSGSPARSRSSASRTSASRPSSTGSRRRVPRSSTRRRASRATARSSCCDWNGITFRLVDTGGVDEADKGPYGKHIAQQARAAVDDADLVLFVVDARAGITPGDEELAAILRAAGKPVIVLANKIDDPRRDLDAVEFHRLGLGDPVAALRAPRARHGRPARRDRRAAAGTRRARRSATRRSASRSSGARTSASRRS